MAIDGVNSSQKTAYVNPYGTTPTSAKANAGQTSSVSYSNEDSYQEVDFSDEGAATPDSASKSGSFSETTPLDVLYTEEAKRQETVSTEEGNVTQTVADEDKNVETAQKTYDEAVKNDDKVSKELKEKESKLSDKVRGYEKNISDAKQKVQSVKTKIAQLDTTISTLNNQIGQLEGQINSLSTNTGDKDQDSANEAAKKQYNAILANKKKELGQAEKSKSEAISQETNYNDTIENNTRALETARIDLIMVENEISKSCSEETKAARKALDDARTTRDTNVKTAEDNLSSARTSLQEIETLIANHKDMPPCNAADVAKVVLGDAEYREYMNMASEVSQYDSRLNLVEGEWCNGFAIYSLAKMYGGLDKIPNNTYDSKGNKQTFLQADNNLNTCYSTAHWAKENGILMDERDDESSFDINKVQPGDFILFNTYCDGNNGRPQGKNYDEWCHIGIVTGVSEDGKTVYTIEGNTATDDDSYSSGGTGVLAPKTRHVDGREFAPKHNGNNLGTSYVLLHNLTNKDKK